SNNGGDVNAQFAALGTIGLTWNKDFSQVTKINSLNGNTTVNFSAADQNPLPKMYGDTWVGIHFGKGAGLGDNVTGFWRFNAGVNGMTSFLLNISKGSSGAVLYKTGVAPTTGPIPEPSTWAMLIAGFGLVGAVARRRRTVTATA
ncbi:MAG: hypothetical protein RL490_1911, partial [Pseudomonadota bacterium]